ncbi:MAG TPA: alpha/beta fold hydrolase [Pyrinomonadaceae bacterium]|nr:alpha/beta fold hydrolase [Pyrinomonadaceae bacterium]
MENTPLSQTDAQQFLSHVAAAFTRKPFKHHALFGGGHAQTLASWAWPRRSLLKADDEERFFRIDADSKILANCRWQANPTERLTVVLWHGMEGSTSSVYMLAIAQKAFAAGFNVVRVNFRNCGGTEHLTPTLYHGGLSDDLRVVLDELRERDGLKRFCLVGYSLGGNIVLKLAGEYADNPPPDILGICAISPSVDLGASADTISRKSNWIYQQDFLRRMRNRIRVKKRHFPDLYDLTDIGSVRTIREFDERYTSRAHGFDGAADYYFKSSSIRTMDRIRIPTLIVHAEDDPFIPFAPLQNPSVTENPYILFIATKKGGHIAFVASNTDGEDRFWAENRVVEFCKIANEELG